MTVILLTILSGVCLLLWGLRTVKRSVLRGYGAQVQRAIAVGTRNRFTSFGTGIFVTFFMQSSLATTMLASSFFGRGLMTLVAGLAIVIGADVGSSIIAQILSFDMKWLAPLLLSTGIIFHLIFDDGSHKRFAARIILGIGFILMGLAIIREATAPLANSATLPLILAPLENEPFLALIIGVAITYVMHSSLSAVLLFASLAGGGALPLELAITFVIGANVGIAIIPMVAVMRDTPQAVQIPLGNIIMRMVVGLIVLACINTVIDTLSAQGWTASQSVIATHIGYNTLLAMLFIPFLPWLAKICERLSPALKSKETEAFKPRYLDKKALSTPPAAISCAMRETLHMAEILELMLVKTMEAIKESDENDVRKIQEMDQKLDLLFSEIKYYIIKLTREDLNDKDSSQCMHIMNFATNLEYSGDVIEKSLLANIEKMVISNDRFSEKGLKEITEIHEKVVKNLKLAQSIFLSSDPILAKQLVQYKKGLYAAESESAANHMQRLREGLPQSVATTGMHMDMIRDLRRINTYITSVAYGVLEK